MPRNPDYRPEPEPFAVFGDAKLIRTGDRSYHPGGGPVLKWDITSAHYGN
jgi:hypothetical protein